MHNVSSGKIIVYSFLSGTYLNLQASGENPMTTAWNPAHAERTTLPGDPPSTHHLVHSHVFLSSEHDGNARRTWLVIALCIASMAIEIICGYLFGSLALIADGLHMSTHVVAFLISALAYSYARSHAQDQRFVFGTGKVGELAAYTSAILLVIIALLILYDGLMRFASPEEVDYQQAVPVACVGLAVNVASGLLLGMPCAGHDSGHGHGHAHGHSHGRERYEYVLDNDEEAQHTEHHPDHPAGHEHEHEHAEHDHDHGHEEEAFCQPCFQDMSHGHGHALLTPEGVEMVSQGEDSFLPRNYTTPAALEVDNNFRAALVHVIADAIVSALVIIALVIAMYIPGTGFLDPLMGCIGSVVILSWAAQLMSATSANLLDICPDPQLVEDLRKALEKDGTVVTDLHVWRLGPGHLGAIIAVSTQSPRASSYYASRIKGFKALSHVTIQVTQLG